jgi:hypothetical protein
MKILIKKKNFMRQRRITAIMTHLGRNSQVPWYNYE